MGAGMCGLTTAMLLARDGHAVTVLERDPEEPPPTVDAAWEAWERRGVGQFRMLHFLQPRWRAEVEVALPELVDEMDALGAVRHGPAGIAARYTGGSRDGDDRLVALTGRRPMIETAVARVAARTPGLTIRRGAPVESLVPGPTHGSGVPHVTGVRLESGEEVHADLTVDAGGRRSAVMRLLDGVGARTPHVEEEDCGLVYYGRHLRSTDGSVPEQRGPLLASCGTLSTLTLPADNGTWGLGLLAATSDKAMRGLKAVDAWERVWRSIPASAHWLDGEPITDGVAVMANVPDRIRHFVVDGEPVATGYVAVADAWACTNPAVGRGITIGLLHALCLRSTLADVGLDDPRAFALAFADAATQRVEPWYRATLDLDRGRLREIEALLATGTYEPDDPRRSVARAFLTGAWYDPDLLRAFMEIGGMLAPTEQVFARPGLLDTVLGFADAEDPFEYPSREELLDLVG